MKKNIKFFALAIFAVLSLFFVTATMAQTTTTGNVEGTVTDVNGAVVPNAALTLSGPNLLRAQTTTSGPDGTYRFQSVPPGRYTLEVAAAAGFAAYRQENIEVNLGRATSADVQVRPAGATETVDVVASAEIDQTTNTTGSNVSTEFFSNIPTSRTVQGLYTIAPTVTRSGLRDASGRDRDPSVAGSSGPENSYILDGVNTTDPAFGGGGANLPFEFVQEVEIKTGSYGADQGLSTGGVFNVITKSGTNEFRGEVFAYGNPSSFVRETKNFPFTGLAPNGFSEVDAGATLGGPIIKNRLTFFAAFNPQFRTNNYLTQTLRQEVEGKIRTPFYSGKLTWSINNNNTFTASTFGDFTKEEGHLFAGSGFGANLDSFAGIRETGGHNYAFRLNSNIGQNHIGEFSFGLHYQRNNVIPEASVADVALITDNFAILRADGSIAPVTQSGVTGAASVGFVDFVFAPGGTLARNFVRDGFGLFQNQSRDRWEAAARMQSIWGKHSFKYGFEFYRNQYDIDQRSTGPSRVYANPLNVPPVPGSNDLDNRSVNGFRVTNNFIVCTTRVIGGVGTVVCPNVTAMNNFNALPVAQRPAGFTANAVCTTAAGATCLAPVANLTETEINSNPFLIRASTRVRDFQLVAQTSTDVESFYIQDDWRVMKNLQFNIGARWDLQQLSGNEGHYFSLNNMWDTLQPRLGVIYAPWGEGKGKFFINYARYIETPIPLDINVRAGSNNTQTDKNFNVNTLNAPASATVASGFSTRNLGAHSTPIDRGLKPQSVNEFTAGFEYAVMRNLALGIRGIYRPQGSVIEDGSFDDGTNYFIFNPGEIVPPTGTLPGNTEYIAGLPPCVDSDDDGDQTDEPGFGFTCGGIGSHFGRARRFYRALEFTANRRFADNYAFTASYVYSSLIGNYEGLFRNDNGQSDPNITSLFDLVSLLENLYGRLPNDRPHQFKFNGTYQTPWRLTLSGNFYIQSGTPFNQLIPHFLYGNNEGFAVPRGTAIVPDNSEVNGNGGVSSAIGTNRTPTTWNLDLGVYYPIRFSENMQLKLTADWFNVTNTQRAITLDQTYQITSGVAGVAPVTNPFWGTGAIFQYPSAVRLGAKFSF